RMRVTPRVARSADFLIAPSRHSAQDIEAVLGVAPDRIAVIPLAIDPRFDTLPRAADVAATLARLGLRGDFLLALARADARKNADRLLDALALLKQRGRSPTLVLASSPEGRCVLMHVLNGLADRG